MLLGVAEFGFHYVMVWFWSAILVKCYWKYNVKRRSETVKNHVENHSQRAAEPESKSESEFVGVHGWRIVETRGGAFPLMAVQFKAE